MDLTPTPSFSTFHIMWFIYGWVAPFHPQSILGTVAPLWIVLRRRVLILVMTGFLPLCLMAIWGIVEQVGAASVTPVFPLAPWPIGVPHWPTGPIAMVAICWCPRAGLPLALELGQGLDLLDQCVNCAFQFGESIIIAMD